MYLGVSQICTQTVLQPWTLVTFNQISVFRSLSSLYLGSFQTWTWLKWKQTKLMYLGVSQICTQAALRPWTSVNFHDPAGCCHRHEFALAAPRQSVFLLTRARWPCADQFPWTLPASLLAYRVAFTYFEHLGNKHIDFGNANIYTYISKQWAGKVQLEAAGGTAAAAVLARTLM